MLMRDGNLDYWSIHTGNAAVVAAASSLIREYKVTHIAIHTVHAQAHFPRQDQLVRDVIQLAEAESVIVRRYSTHELRENLHGGHVNKAGLFRRLSEEYPELSRPYHKYMHQGNRYWNRLFEAVACACFIAME